jgi:WD40 repeat protein
MSPIIVLNCLPLDSGGSDGNVFVWNNNTLQKTVKAHEGPLFAMHSLDKVCIS